MTSTVRIMPHPAPGLRAEVVVQDYEGDKITREETIRLYRGKEHSLTFWDGRQITLREVKEELPAVRSPES